MAALEFHSQAAKLYRDNAMEIRDQNCKFFPENIILSKT
jgi:hypothetical protein